MSAPLEWAELWAAMDAAPAEWIETTERMYFEMLECVPPRAMRHDSFLVGEPKTHNERGEAVHACFSRIGVTFHAKHMTVAEFQRGPRDPITQYYTDRANGAHAAKAP